MVQYDLEESINADAANYETLTGGSFLSTSNGYRTTNARQTTYNNLNDWQQIAESALPLKASAKQFNNYGNFAHNSFDRSINGFGVNGHNQGGSYLQSSIEVKSKEISRKLIIVNLVSLLINLLLAITAFYFAFLNDSPSTTAFAADCVLDFISSAIVLWRYYGDLNSVYMHAREQIACIYLGALFEVSALAIIVKASSDMVSGPSASGAELIDGDDVKAESLIVAESSNELVYLAIVATLACSVLTVFKCALYKTIRDKSILLDVINTLISTVFALSIVMSQVLINVNPSFWYLDPILSIVLALFMAAFGLKVIHQNFNILKPSNASANHSIGSHFDKLSMNNNNNYDFGPDANDNHKSHNNRNNHNKANTNSGAIYNDTNYNEHSNYSSNLNASIENARLDRSNAHNNWQKTNYSTISFV